MNNLFVFNPTCDLSISFRNANYQPNPLLVSFENELSYLMSFITNNGDGVVVEKIPDEHYQNFLSCILGFSPEFIQSNAKFSDNFSVIPWGWSPVIHKKYFTKKWDDSYTHFFSRQTGYKLIDNCTWSLPQFIKPLYFYCTDIKEVVKILHQYKRIVVKSPWSSSGRGVVFLNDLLDKMAMQWIDGFIKGQGFVYVEPQYDKIADFSLLFKSSFSGVEYVGETFFFTSDMKQYLGHYIGNHCNIKEKITEYSIVTEALIDNMSETFLNAFKSLDLKNYHGWFGVDCMIVKQDSELRIVPFCELNVRCTMGFIAHAISKLCTDIKFGKMIIDKYSNIENLIYLTPSDFSAKKIIPLVPVTKQNKFAAWIEISED